MSAPVDASAAASAIAILVRQALSGRVQGAPRQAKAREAPFRKERHTAPSPDLAGVITARVAQLDPDASDFRPRVLRLLIEAALLQEFGSSVMNAPRFQGLIDLVSSEIESAPQLQTDIETVLFTLTGPRRGDSG